ncbi:MAG: hypothetical protein RLN70_09480, partial [Rhodospirillaceae bacterium]
EISAADFGKANLQTAVLTGIKAEPWTLRDAEGKDTGKKRRVSFVGADLREAKMDGLDPATIDVSSARMTDGAAAAGAAPAVEDDDFMGAS